MNLKDFRNPPIEFRPIPFLSVNDDLQEDEFLRQYSEFIDKGWGGIFFHSRVGLLTPYLGNRWFNLIKACIKKAKELGTRLWLYDEDNWPSGKGGNMVTNRRPEFRQKFLYYEKVEGQLPPGTISTYDIESTDEGKVKYAFCVEWMPKGWIPDLMNPETVDAFIECTHELYRIQIGKEFGKTVPGIFTDEPQYGNHHRVVRKPSVPWTSSLPEEFEKDHGYSLIENLQSIFFDVGNFRKVRYDFRYTSTRLYVDSYSKKLYEWCDANNLQYTGHYEWEDSFVGQIHCVGSVMQHYEYMHIPGIDRLGRSINNPPVPKQVSSIASQLGRKRVLSETYGVSGQNLSFHDRRWIGNWEYALGVNFLNHHLALYSMRGERKRDYPPTLSPHQPWWSYNKAIADYFTRLSYVLSQGERVTDILVISPVGSAWCEYRPDAWSGAEKLWDSFFLLTGNLLSIQRDFDYGEEVLMEKYAGVKDGKLTVGRASYSIVIVPSGDSLRRNTLDLLKKFAASGGLIYCVDSKPGLLEGESDDEIVSFFKQLPLIANSTEDLSKVIDAALPRPLDIEHKGGASLSKLILHQREIDGKGLFFLVNTDWHEPMHLSLGFGDHTEEWVAESGEIRPVRGEGGNPTFEIAGGAGRIFVTGDSAAPKNAPSAELVLPAPEKVHEISGVWDITKLGPNAAALDFARYRPFGGDWSEVLPVWKVCDGVKALGAESPFEVEYTFEIANGFRPESLYLILEDAHRFDVYVNGNKVPSGGKDWWMDRSFEKLDILGVSHEGQNFINMLGRFDTDMSIEDAYLIGNFGVEIRGRKSPLLIEEVKSTDDISDLVDRSYPFFAGTLELKTEFELQDMESDGGIFLEFDELGGTVVEIELNGLDAGKLFWREYRLGVSGRLNPGKNRLKLKITNSLRNLLGPRHWQADEFTGVNPLSFRDRHGWTDDYVFVPLGISGLRLAYRRI